MDQARDLSEPLCFVTLTVKPCKIHFLPRYFVVFVPPFGKDANCLVFVWSERGIEYCLKESQPGGIHSCPFLKLRRHGLHTPE